ncbi:tRNA pseudouridine synthase B [Ancylobacter novellus DSM 506]|uniref:tRNA pseudouridine synthase B n=1 Tax=Ancylobacter novellus (strain ATCC 8093 / DSM 506 / JCM 20403 / CCM 1077 / IAM 12100 / NBRC 12443 / NCIMB 10456) TaxID=639283 RepID=D6ZZH5_ANCN5|nr:tRNA pseudouridine(55) synthase TruB [Ancylobacter novellus]ADH91170.1 tRNA pseudouridine synthase B [Ancylobacter novellus DSM 506]
MNAPLDQDALRSAEAAEAPARKRRPKRDVDGWVLLDKPVGMTSTQAVGAVKWLFQAKKAGHAGTLDPLASGCLPVALGEATKTVPFVMDGRKVYRFTVRWGIQTDTDDSEGKAVETSEGRPSREEILAALPAFRGEIEQVPPAYSALKINGERAYDLARDGVQVELAARIVIVHSLELVEMPDADHAVFETECGKGTYVRSIARDLGRALGTRGHISALRRTRVGTFAEEELVPLAELRATSEAMDDAPPMQALRPVEIGLDSLPSLRVSPADAARLVHGQPIILRGRDAPILEGPVAITAGGRLVALGEAEAGEIHPKRIFHSGK